MPRHAQQERPGSRGRLAAVLVTAGLARAVYLTEFLRSPLRDVVRLDQLYYREWALRIAGGDLRGAGVFEQGPLYAYLLGGLYRLIGPKDPWVIALQLACGVATALLVGACARRAFGAPAGLAAGLLAALYGPFLAHEAMIMKSFLEPLLVALALWSGMRAREDGRARWAALAGAAVGSAGLVREAHLLLLLPLALPLRRGAGRRRLAPLALGVLIPLAPAAARNCLVAGECALVTSGGGEVLYIAFGPDATGYYAVPDFVRPYPHLEHEDFRLEARLRTGRALSRGEASRFWVREAARAVGEDPGRAAGLLVRKAAILFNDFEVPDSEQYSVMKDHLPLLRVLPGFGWLFGLGLLGIGLAAGRGGGGRAGLPLWFAAVLVAQVLLTYNFARFRLALAAVWIVFCGEALAELAAAWRRGPARRRGALAGCALAGVATATAFASPPGLQLERRALEEGRYRDDLSRAARARDTLPALQRAAIEHPRLAAPHLAVARALRETGRISEAVGAYREALGAEPGSDEAFRELVTMLLRHDRLEEAEALSAARARGQPDSPETLEATAAVLEQRAHTAPPRLAPECLRRAREAFAEILRRHPRDADALFRFGRLSILAGDREAALGALSAALEADPGHGGAAHLLELLRRRGE